MSSKKYYKDINIVRVLSCIAVLLYHLNILKGGYLAVCTFFVLSGYLSWMSAYKSEDFKIGKYYKNKLLKLYLPLVMVVFITTAIIPLFENIHWFNLKRETTSVLFGYNNFWQLNANLDYFARHVDSPFMHLWYISILLQFDLIFPFIYMWFKNMEEKTSKIVPCIISTLLSLASLIYFYIMCKNKLMNAYYNTFTRVFSIMLGVTAGMISMYYGALIPKKLKNVKTSKIIFYLYIILLILSFIFVKSNSKYFALSIILVSIISCRLLDYGRIDTSNLNKVDNFFKSLTSICYEVYLFQYPIIYIFQYINVDEKYRILLIIFITLLLSYIFNICIVKRNKNKNKFKNILFVLIILVSLYGAYNYITAIDYQKEMDKLKEQLAVAESEMIKKQENYKNQIKEEEENWIKELNNLDNVDNYKKYISSLNVVGIGDSVMLGAVNNLYNTFPNGYFDAKVSRSMWAGITLLKELNEQNRLGDPIVMHLGANGDCSKECKIQIMKECKDRTVFWLNTTNLTSVNDSLKEFAKDYPNLHIIDWYSASKGHSNWFYADGIHLPEAGREAYTKLIYDNIYEVYKKKYKEKRDALVNEHKEELKSRISFYGNDILFYNFDALESNFESARLFVSKDYTYKTLKEKIESSVKENTLSNKIVLAFDNSMNMDLKSYQEIIELCKDSTIYIVSTSKLTNSLNNYSNVKIINFYSDIEKNKSYLEADMVHLTEKGNAALIEKLKENTSV